MSSSNNLYAYAKQLFVPLQQNDFPNYRRSVIDSEIIFAMEENLASASIWKREKQCSIKFSLVSVVENKTNIINQ